MIKHIELENHEGKTLRGYLHLPTNFNGTIVVFYHGFTGNKTEHGGHFRDFSRLLEKGGSGSLRMDFSGNGESDGSFNDFTMDTMVKEAELLIDYALKVEGLKSLVLLGFSMGGALAAYIAGKREADIDKLILWSPAKDILNMIKTRYEHTDKLPNGDADFGNYPLSLKMYKSTDNYDFLEGVNNFKKNVLIIHGRKDLAVNVEAAFVYEKLYKNVKVHIIESAGHGYDKRIEKEELLNESYKFVRG